MTARLLNAYGAAMAQDEAVARIRAYAGRHGVRAAAREFQVSVFTASSIANGHGNISGRRITSWLTRGMIACPALGFVSRPACAAHAAFALSRAARLVSNPDKLKLYAACRICGRRGNNAG